MLSDGVGRNNIWRIMALIVLRAATQKLHVSQPAVSRQIRDLKDELGVPLFERTGKAVSLTDAGRVFLREARAVLARTDEAVKNLRDFAR